MLDHPEKTSQLLAALKASVPFEVELTPVLVKYLRKKHADDFAKTRHTVHDLSYAGDEGGIVCHLSRSDETGKALVVSLTHVLVARSMAHARAVADYQNHRSKKLKKQSGM